LTINTIGQDTHRQKSWQQQCYDITFILHNLTQNLYLIATFR